MRLQGRGKYARSPFLPGGLWEGNVHFAQPDLEDCGGGPGQESTPSLYPETRIKVVLTLSTDHTVGHSNNKSKQAR